MRENKRQEFNARRIQKNALRSMAKISRVMRSRSELEDTVLLRWPRGK
jgi:hypothetical protein